MKLLLTSFFTVLLLFSYIGSYPQSHPDPKADSAGTKSHPPPSNTAAASTPSKTSVNSTSAGNAPTTNSVAARPDTVKASTTDLSVPQPDDEFNIFLMAISIAFFSMILGGALIGVFAVTILLLALLALVLTGILSAGILAGLYRRSIAAGFRTILVITCSLGGIMGGTICFWLINRIFTIHLTSSTAALIGAFGGLLCGLLLSFILAGILRIFLNYCRQKLYF
jgi:hypothetical protein